MEDVAADLRTNGLSAMVTGKSIARVLESPLANVSPGSNSPAADTVLKGELISDEMAKKFAITMDQAIGFDKTKTYGDCHFKEIIIGNHQRQKIL